MELELSRWQREWMSHFDDPLYIACTAISCGKTRVLAMWIVLQCLQKPRIRGIIIAQTHSALRKVLIHDILMFATKIGVSIEWNKSNQELKFRNGSVLFGYSSENPEGVLGLSEIDILAIDEAAYCSEEIYNYARDRMRGGKYNPMVRLISSPSVTSRAENWFSTVVKNNPDKVVRATYRDNPFTKEEFKRELEERYVIGSNLFRQQCLGEIFDTDVASQIVFRRDFTDSKRYLGSVTWAGADMSGLGADSDAFIVVDEYGMRSWRTDLLENTFQKSDTLKSLYDEFKFEKCLIDGTGGYGSGALDMCKSKSIPADQVNFAQKAVDSEKYPNARTEMYMILADKVKHGFWVCEEVREELLAQSVFINNRGQVQLVPKCEVKRILGHSPDLCDALALAVYAMHNRERNDTNRTPEEERKRASQIADRYISMFNMYN